MITGAFLAWLLDRYELMNDYLRGMSWREYHKEQ